MNKKTIFIFDQAMEPGGSIDRIIEIMNALNTFQFIFATLKPLADITNLTLADHIRHVQLFSISQRFNLSNSTEKNSTRGIARNLLSLYSRATSRFEILITDAQLRSITKRYDINLVQSNSDVHKLPFRLAKRLNVPLISFMRSQIDFFWWSKEQLDQCDQFICVSEALKSYYVNTLPVPAEKFRVIHSPFDALLKLSQTKPAPLSEKAQLLLSDGNVTAAHISRFCPDKGQLDVVKALKILKDDGIVLNVIFAGPFEKSSTSKAYQDEVYNFIRNNELESQVEFLGFRKDAMHIINVCDFFLHTATYFEGLGGTVIEAIQLGKMVVASNLGGPLETVVEGKTGYFYEVSDIKSLSNCLLNLLKYNLLIIDKTEMNNIMRRFDPLGIFENIHSSYLELTDIKGCNEHFIR